jgi:Icc-related predicted phosphoesterase
MVLFGKSDISNEAPPRKTGGTAHITDPRRGKPMNIFAISDIHGFIEPMDHLERQIASADMVLVAGDITRNGRGDEARLIMERIEGLNGKILAVHGNWDGREVLEYLEQKKYSLHADGRIIDGIGFLGLGGSSPIPIKTRTEYREEEILDFLETGMRKVSAARSIVLVSHVPPRGMRDRTFLGLRGGSRSLRDFLLRNPVSACICGHIHEAWGIERFDSLTVANAGSFRKGTYITGSVNGGISLAPGRVLLKKGLFHR